MGGHYDPATFDALLIKYALGRFASRRNAANVHLAKKNAPPILVTEVLTPADDNANVTTLNNQFTALS
jgi:hypothetical protein